MKSLFYALFLFIFSFSISAQSTFNVKGIVEDTLGNSLISSTVLLLDKADSTLVEFTRTEIDGSFIFKKIPAGNYLVKTTYVAYIPQQVDASSTGKNVDLGTIKMTELAAELMEVVIKAAKAPIVMRGDTIEYDASTFQVPEGSSVEELLRQLPGIEIDQDGGLSSDGMDIKKVTVDGKSFFGSDPKAATKNLPAEGISKVQVFDTKTEEEKITGVTGDAESKTMNLELKDDFKKGGFGRVTGGVGTESRKELKGNYNRFNEKIQLSLVAVGNNTGRNGLSWDDYQDFMGSSGFNFSSDGDYGFGGGNGMMYMTFGGGNGNDIESSVQSVFFSNSRGGGFPENYNGGLNFNYNHKKTEISSVYYYNQAGLLRETSADKRIFFQDYTLNNINKKINNDLSRGHRGEFSIDQEIDSFHSFKIEIKGAIIDQDFQQNSEISLSKGEDLSSNSTFDNDLNTTGNLLNGVVFFRKKFKRKARRFGANFSFLSTELDDDGLQKSTTNFYDLTGVVDSTSIINQNTGNEAKKQVIKSNAIYVEPLSKVFFSETFYNYSHRTESGDRTVNDIFDVFEVRNIDLSRKYDNTIQLNRIGQSIRYSKDGMNISVGAAYQQFDLFGTYEKKGDPSSKGVVDKKFVTWIPNANFSMSPARNARFSVGYSVNTNEPNISQLQSIVNNSNPLYITEGNADLTPEIGHGVNFRFRRSYPLSGIRFHLSGRYNLYTNRIINSEIVDENLITYTKPINYKGGDSYRAYTNFSFPIIKNKIKLSLSMSYNYNNSFAYVNDFLNKTVTNSYRPSLYFTITPGKKTNIYINAQWNLVDTKYDINTSQDQLTQNNSYGITFNSILFWGLYINSSFDYDQYVNERFAFQESVPVLNASIYKQFLKGKRAEVRLAMYDGFNRNLNISQFTGGNSITESRTVALGRYYMLSFSYNIKGLKDGVSGGRW